MILAKNTNSKYWIKYFSIENNLINESIDLKKYKNEMNQIKSESKDTNLQRLIEKKLARIYE